MNRSAERNDAAGKGKKPYEKPRLRRIKLEAGEVLAKGCKLEGAGSNFGNPVGCIAPSACVNTGS